MSYALIGLVQATGSAGGLVFINKQMICVGLNVNFLTFSRCHGRLNFVNAGIRFIRIQDGN